MPRLGRPRVADNLKRRTRSITLPPAVYLEVEQVARANGLDFSRCVEIAVRQWLKNPMIIQDKAK